MDDSTKVNTSQSIRQWRILGKAYCSGKLDRDLPPKPKDIPTTPRKSYEAEWVDIYDWLGKSRTEYPPFEEVRRFIRALNLSGSIEYKAHVKGQLEDKPKCPYTLTVDPKKVYGKDWVSWPNFLGTEIVWRSFHDARSFVRSLNLRTTTNWKAYRQGLLPGYDPKPNDIPANPDQMYRGKGWISYSDWLRNPDSDDAAE
jgi:hypothetical protein